MCTDGRVTRRELLGAGVGAGTLLVAGCVTPDPGPPDGSLRIHHLDVGQADATLLETPENETVVIDTGDWTDGGQAVINHLESLRIDHVDHLVATHAHADHIGGHAELIEHFETERNGIGLVYDSGIQHTSQAYLDYIDAVEGYGHELVIVEEDEWLPVDGVDVFVLNPPAGESGDDIDYNCVGLRVEHEAVSYLTTGDAGESAEQRMVSAWTDQLSADIYQAGHHGSSTSSTDAFVGAVDPDTTVISSAYDSQFGHPDDEVLYTFDEFDVGTYWTGVHGEAVMTIDGETVETDTDEPFSTDPLDILAEKPETATGADLPVSVTGSGTMRAVVDRIEGEAAVVLPESSGGVVGQSLVPAGRLPPGAGERTVLSVTVDRGAVRDIRADAATSEKRSQAIAERVEQLSTPLSEIR